MVKIPTVGCPPDNGSSVGKIPAIGSPLDTGPGLLFLQTSWDCYFAVASKCDKQQWRNNAVGSNSTVAVTISSKQCSGSSEAVVDIAVEDGAVATREKENKKKKSWLWQVLLMIPRTWIILISC